MDFIANRPIYLQIHDFVIDNILTGRWPEEGRIPSVRELAAEIDVNPNTVARTYSVLSDKELINNLRGIGYFVSKEATIKAKNYVREEFIKNELPSIFKKMEQLDINFDDLKIFYNESYQAKSE